MCPSGNRRLVMCSQPSGDKWARSPGAGWCPLIAQVIDGALQVGRIPQNNGRDEQI